jgi:hypothetical protein
MKTSKKIKLNYKKQKQIKLDVNKKLNIKYYYIYVLNIILNLNYIYHKIKINNNLRFLLEFMFKKNRKKNLIINKIKQ